MEIFLKMDAQKVLGRIDSREARMRQALTRWQEIAGDTVLREAMRLAPIRTGGLRKSLFAEASGTVVKVGSRLPYAAFVNNGTRPHTIRPVSGKALRFRIGGRVVFAKSVKHPGNKGQRFLQRALEAKKDFITALLKQYTLQESQLLD